MSRVYNFSAGPAVLPEEVLQECAAEMMDYKGCGMSVMEMSHRSKVYDQIIKEAEADLRDLMNIPDNYKVLFIQGGGHVQFAMVPMNLMKNKVADYVITGQWAKKACKEAALYGEAKAVASSEDEVFSYIPDCSDLPIDDNADYLYICMNNTIYGTVFHELPNTKGKDLVADISSCFLSGPLDVSKFGIIFAGAQKNLAPAGVTVVVIRKDLAGHEQPITPLMLNYKTMIDKDSMYNTPPCYNIYMLGLVMKWIQKQGGLEAMDALRHEKSALLYSYLDESRFFHGCAEKEARSFMNVTFNTGDPDKDAAFCKAATAAGFVNVKGHRLVGGMRASIYNAVPVKAVKALVEFMKDYEVKNRV